MLSFLLRRLAVKALLVIAAASLAYFLAAISLNPAEVFLRQQVELPASAINAALNTYNVNPDTPLLLRYLTWIGGVFRGEFGLVLQTQDPIADVLVRRMGVSLRLLLIGTVLAVVIGVLVGVAGAVRQHKLDDHIVVILSFVLLSTPIFLLANVVKAGGDAVNRSLGFILVYSDGEYHTGPDAGLIERLQHLALPTIVIVLGYSGFAFFSRYQRSAMLDVLGSDYIRTARAKGLTKRQAYLRHGLRVALIPMATFFAFTFGLLVVGATFIERIFNWNGMGQWAIDAISNNDVNSIAAITLVVAILVMISSFLADVIHAVLDPRIRVSQEVKA